ncbi:MAG: 30S ribosome-binding factor RbfA, partial [Nitrospinota bacterium]
PYQRADRVGDLIRRELAAILQSEVKDPRIGFVSLTQVEVSPDLRQAKVYVSVYGSSEEQASALEGLQSASGFSRSLLGRRLRLKRIPELVFLTDPSIARGARIHAAIANLKD